MPANFYTGFSFHKLDESHGLWSGTLPGERIPDRPKFEQLWQLHPENYHDIVMHGRPLKTPRWQQAYLRDYAYTGSRNDARPLPAELEPYWQWCRERIDERLNGLLLNWYDGSKRHYIGKHRDTPQQLLDDAPIVTISLGESRWFRLRPWKGSGYRDFAADNGTVFLLPAATNRAWTHEVPHFAKRQGRRISITLRAFR